MNRDWAPSISKPAFLSQDNSVETPDYTDTPSSKGTRGMELANVTGTSLCFFNCQISTWSLWVRLSTQIQADPDSRWVVLEDGLVFC